MITRYHLEQQAVKPNHRRWIRREAVRGKYLQDRLIEQKIDAGFHPSNNIYPSLFHAWPLRAGRVDKTVRAMQRIDRRRQFTLPKREEYQSTVDLYEAALPVLKSMKQLDEDQKSIAPVPSLSIRGMLHNLKSHLFF